ncbi:MAG: hypothetical protein J0H43_13745, partial [Actinobacteria bacterium]|nr:hypothetical protein [Actinomycetota bacterium]
PATTTTAARTPDAGALATPPPAQTQLPAQRWTALCDAVDPRISADPHWPALAAQLGRAAERGADVDALLREFADAGDVSDRHPARNLGYLVADAVPDIDSPAHRRASLDQDTTAITPVPPPPAPNPAAPQHDRGRRR